MAKKKVNVSPDVLKPQPSELSNSGFFGGSNRTREEIVPVIVTSEEHKPVTIDCSVKVIEEPEKFITVRVLKEKTKKKNISSDKRTAYHEAGHAVVSYVLGMPVLKATIVPEKHMLGHVKPQKLPRWFKPDIECTPQIQRKIENKIQVCFAGNITEKVFFKRYDNKGSSADDQLAVQLAEYANGSIKATEAYLKWLFVCTEETVNTDWVKNAIADLADVLLKRKSLKEQEILEIIRTSQQKTWGIKEKHELSKVKSNS